MACRRYIISDDWENIGRITKMKVDRILQLSAEKHETKFHRPERLRRGKSAAVEIGILTTVTVLVERSKARLILTISSKHPEPPLLYVLIKVADKEEIP